MPDPVMMLRRCLDSTCGTEQRSDGLLLAVSGGADSMALLHSAHLISAERELRCVVAHLDHGLRSESASDAAWVAAQAAELGFEAVISTQDVRHAAAAHHRGVEEIARRVRYDFLRETAERHRITYVLTAHTADDVVETVLHHVLRGTSLRGLRGIAPRRRLSQHVTLLRPFLEVRREEIERFLASLGQPFLTDATNRDVAFTRNRLRHEVLPLLRSTVNPQVDAALLRLGRQAAETSALISKLARRELKLALIESSRETIRLSSRRLKTRPRALVRETIVLAWRRAGWPQQAMGFDHWNGIASIAIRGGRRTLPGGTDARRRQGELILRREPT